MSHWTQWKTQWKTHLQYYIDAKGITAYNRKGAMLLHLAGPAVQDIFSAHTGAGTTYIDT